VKDKKTHTLHLRLTQAERQTLDRMARESGRRVSAVVRALMQEALINRMNTAANQKSVTR
jgi:hypothetical protein